MSWMPDEDIVNSYETARNKKARVDSLAAQCRTTRQAMMEKLFKLGCIDADQLARVKPLDAPGRAQRPKETPKAPARRAPGGARNRIDDREAWFLYDGGMPDTKIAAVLGVTQSSVVYWRKRNGLPAKFKRGRNG